MTQLDKKSFLVPISIIIGAIIIATAIVLTRTPSLPEALEQKGKAQIGLEEEKKPEQKEKFQLGEKDHLRGNPEAPVTIVEFSDFQCPFCERFHKTVQQVLADYPDQVRWVYKHFPLDSIHSQARSAAEASECAWEQKGNKGFWQFADLLFENQQKLGKGLYQELAKELGLDEEQFNTCLSSRKYKDKVEVDYQQGIKAGVRGTPGSFVNEQEIPGAVPYETLKSAVERVLSN